MTRLNGAVRQFSRVFRSTTTSATRYPSLPFSLPMSGSRTRKFSEDEKAQLLANLELEGQ